MTEQLFDTKSLLLKVKALDRLRSVLLREGKGYQNVLHKRCGDGLTPEQFDQHVVQILVDHHVCVRIMGERGAVTLMLNTNVPENAKLLTEPDQHNETR
jgi:hypothetical protein